jgi:NAD-specific glutamate dehydrogenase
LTDLARANGAPLRETARIRLAVLDCLQLDELRARSAALAPADTFDQQAIDTGLAALTTAESRLMSRILADPTSRGQDIAAWLSAAVPPIAASRATIGEVLANPGFSIARLAVAAESLRIASQSGKA